MDGISQERLGELAPKVKRLGGELLTRLEAEGYYFRITQGLRTWSQQNAIWMKGRDADGNIVDENLVVTHAPPGHSWHEFAVAFDGAPMVESTLLTTGQEKPAFFPDWSPPTIKGVARPPWARWLAIGEELGMTSGSRWAEDKCDWPHFQVTGKFPYSPTDEVRLLFHDSGLRSIWEAAGLME